MKVSYQVSVIKSIFKHILSSDEYKQISANDFKKKKQNNRAR